MLIAPVWYTAAAVSPPLAAVLASMELDNISLAAKNDSIILNYGGFVAQNCTASQHTCFSAHETIQIHPLSYTINPVTNSLILLSNAGLNYNIYRMK